MKIAHKISKLFGKLGNAYGDFCQRIGTDVSPF
jgi:hypothetical protein